MVCHPPPPPLAAVVVQAAQLINQRVAPIATPRACLGDHVPAGSGQATSGAIWLARADAALYVRPARTWPADRHVTLLHEVLHGVAMERGLRAEHLHLEEALVEAVTQDLRPVWLRRQIGRDVRVAVAYRDRVGAVRRWSARATGATWPHARARDWRIAILATPPAQRPAPE